MRVHCAVVAAALAIAAAAACDAAARPAPAPQEERTMPMTLTSTAFPASGAIPRKHTCDGGDLSPPLNWSGLPQGTRSLALIVDDPDAPDPAAPKMVWVHWVLYDIPPCSRRAFPRTRAARQRRSAAAIAR